MNGLNGFEMGNKFAVETKKYRRVQHCIEFVEGVIEGILLVVTGNHKHVLVFGNEVGNVVTLDEHKFVGEADEEAVLELRLTWLERLHQRPKHLGIERRGKLTA